MKQLIGTTVRAGLATVLGLCAVTAAGFGGNAAAAAETVTGTSLLTPAQATMSVQTTLVDAASGLRTAIRAEKPRGYAGLGLVGDHVALWWKGKLPSDIAAAVTTARHLAPVTVHTAPFSETQLRGAAAKVRAAVASGNDAVVHGVHLKADGSGLQIEVEPGKTIPTLPATGVPVSTVRMDKPKPVANRESGESPWTSGTLMWGTAGGGCSAGIGVKDASTGAPYLLTAAHCGPAGTEWADPAGHHVGTTTVTNEPHDIGLISVPAVSGRIFTGGPTDEVQSQVTGWTEVFPGQILCQSGYTSANTTGGPVCNLEVQYLSDDEGNFAVAEQLDGNPGARSGDSGGPVYQMTGDGTVLAAGVTSWVSGDNILGFQDFATVRNDFGDIVPATSTGTSACRVSYQIASQWSGNYTANVTIYNSAGPITNWNLGWDLAAGSTITSRWNAQTSQIGSHVTAVGETYNRDIPAAGALNFGFLATGTPNTPPVFTLNGIRCA